MFVQDEGLKVKDWPIAKVSAIHPGDDGITRVVDIACRGKTYRRPVLKLIPEDRVVAAPDCGLGFLGRDLAMAKLRNLSAAAGMV